MYPRATRRSRASTFPSLPIPRLDPPYSLPQHQHLYRYHSLHRAWFSLPKVQPSPVHTFTCFQVLTWNIDFSPILLSQRTNAILDHIEAQLVAVNELGIPTIILFQEVHRDAFPILLSHPFLQTHYDLTNISNASPAFHYGTISFVPRALSPFVNSVIRIPFENSQMGRDALIIDLDLPRYPDFPHSFPSLPSIARVRIVNTHLESLRGHGDTARPEQLRFISHLLSGVHAGIAAGDMNAIGPTDPEVPQSLGLADCWEMVKPRVAPEAGYTWGYQSHSNSRHPPGRLDKVLFAGGLYPVSIERFGVGLYLGEPHNKIWLSDHYGLLAQFMIT